MHHGVEGKQPHTGPKAFAAMRQQKERQSTTTLPAIKQGNQAVTKATRYPEGGTSVQTGPGRHTGPTAGGREATIGREGSRQQPNKQDRHRGAQLPTERSTTTTERHQQSRRQKHRHNKTTNTERPSPRRNKTRPGTKDGRESTAQIKAAPEKLPNHEGGATRGQNPT